MDKIVAIARKETTVNMKSPVSYILMCLAIIVFNIFFFIIIDENREATLRDMFTLMEFLFVFIIPLLTMKTVAHENETGTMEFLKTTPTTNTAIVAGKYLGVVIYFTTMLALTFPYYVIIEVFANPDRMAIFAGYFGIWLEGLFFLAIGVMTSVWTKSQVLAAMSSYILILALYFAKVGTKYLQGVPHDILSFLSVMGHSESFFQGLLTSSDIMYFISGTLFCLTIARLSTENRIWK